MTQIAYSLKIDGKAVLLTDLQVDVEISTNNTGVTENLQNAFAYGSPVFIEGKPFQVVDYHSFMPESVALEERGKYPRHWFHLKHRKA